MVAEHCFPSTGRAIIHVSTPHVDVMVDEVTYPVESLGTTPIVCELRPGHHMVRMLQNGRTLYEEPFTLKPGEELILSAWDGYDDGRCPPWTDFSERRSKPVARRASGAPVREGTRDRPASTRSIGMRFASQLLGGTATHRRSSRPTTSTRSFPDPSPRRPRVEERFGVREPSEPWLATRGGPSWIVENC
jgi:hypothetical protein